MTKLKSLLILCCAMLGFFFTAQAHAHKVIVFAYLENDQVFVEGYFVDGKKIPNSAVTIFDAQSDVLLIEGRSDEEGKYHAAAPEAKALKVVVNAGGGHSGSVFIGTDDSIVDAAEPNHPPHSTHEVTQEHAASIDTTLASNVTVDTVDHDALDTAVKNAVNEAIRPLVRQLNESQQKASLSGIIGGVGYLVGILGLWAFLKARRLAADKS